MAEVSVRSNMKVCGAKLRRRGLCALLLVSLLEDEQVFKLGYIPSVLPFSQ